MENKKVLKKLQQAFKAEAEERIQNISTGLVALEQLPDDADRHAVVEVIFREAHSLKGAARAVSLTDIEVVCQAIEGVFSSSTFTNCFVSTLIESFTFVTISSNSLL